MQLHIAASYYGIILHPHCHLPCCGDMICYLYQPIPPHTHLFLRYSRHKPRIVFKAAYGHNDNHLAPRRGLDFTARTTTCVIIAVSRFPPFVPSRWMVSPPLFWVLVTLFPDVLSMGFSHAWLLLSKTGQQMIIRSYLVFSRLHAMHHTGIS